MYRWGVESAGLAYDAHEAPKVLVSYEELRADTLSEMKRIYTALEIPVDKAELARSVEKHSWENVSEEEKGQSKFYRRGWREDLTPTQGEVVERTTASLLERPYPEA